jgi:hypothetical protein
VEVDDFHTSCSAPLELGDVFGNLVLVGWDGARGSANVTYRYVVTNNGDTLTNVSLEDTVDGIARFSAGPFDLAGGDTTEFIFETGISDTTTNIAAVKGDLINGQQCTASDSVTVTMTEPTCEVSVQLDKIEDRKIKFKLSNPSSIAAIIETLTVTWPGNTNLIKIKYDGAEILKDVLPSSPATITSGEWLKEPKDRTVEAGDTGKTLELEFTANFPDKNNQDPNDFDLTVTFEQGCEVSF